MIWAGEEERRGSRTESGGGKDDVYVPERGLLVGGEARGTEERNMLYWKVGSIKNVTIRIKRGCTRGPGLLVGFGEGIKLYAEELWVISKGLQ
jgi:hypothetical protein